MTILDYFRANREADGRAWLDRLTWIDERDGVLRLNATKGVVTLPPGEDIAFILQEYGSYLDLSSAESDSSDPATEHFDDAVDEEERVFADQFDDYAAGGGWPGLSADDAEPGDFEDD